MTIRVANSGFGAGDSLGYLAIPESYFAWLGGLRWSEDAEVIEYREERPGESQTFAMLGEVSLFLEGFAASGPLPCFGHILHFLELLGTGRRTEMDDDGPDGRQPGEIRRLFRDCGRPFRNAGALAAFVSGEVPRGGRPVEVSELCRSLDLTRARPRQLIRTLVLSAGEAPLLSPLLFSARVLKNLAAMRSDELRHWLQSGRPPAVGGDDLASIVRPRTLADILNDVEKRPRMVASSALVGQLLGALTIPPRRLSTMELPTDGYSDVATRGQPEQLLLSQFALDSTELLRRFAERELLYFRREEPKTPTSQELLVVIDQGVRTWGGVRLVLAAAALAMGRLADRRGIRFRAITTGDPGAILDPIELGEPSFGERLETSDLSPIPTEPLATLAKVLRDAPTIPRDVVLLTHARSLREPSVQAAAAALPMATRLFGIGVGDRGDVNLSEIHPGGAVAISRCRVPKPAESGVDALPTVWAPFTQWTGNVELIPFPFPFPRVVLGKNMTLRCDFDLSGQWLFAAGFAGVVHACQINSGETEIFPRGAFHDAIVKDVVGLVGILNGVVVLGRVDTNLIAVQYDRTTRQVWSHWVDRIAETGSVSACFLPDRRCVVVRLPSGSVRCVDLTQDSRRSTDPHATNFHREARTSDGRAKLLRDLEQQLASSHADPVGQGGVATPSTAFLSDDEWFALASSGVLDRPLATVDPTRDALRFRLAEDSFETWRPMSNGEPVLKRWRPLRTLVAGPVAAIAMNDSQRNGQDDWCRLFLFEQPSGRLLRVITGLDWLTALAISRDGRRIAFVHSNSWIQVQDVVGLGHDWFRSPVAPAANPVRVWVGQDRLLVSTWQSDPRISWQFLRWDSDGLHWSQELPANRPVESMSLTPVEPIEYASREANDPRFVGIGFVGPIHVMLDCFNQIIFRNRDGDLIAIFLIVQNELAAWMPDGTRIGPPELIGGPPTPDGSRKIGRTMQAACRLDQPWTVTP